MHDGLLIYGATGFTGRQIVREARARGLAPLLAGRSKEKLSALSRNHGLEYRVAALDDSTPADFLAGVHVVLNAAGPFRRTAPALAAACLARGVHYLDISGEIASIEALARLDSTAQKSGCMLLPGAGFDVVPSDCLLAHVAAALPGADRLSLGLSGLNAVSRGSAASVFDQAAQLVTVRRDGTLVQVPPGQLVSEFDFGSGRRAATAINWGDVASAYYSTGIQNIAVYYERNPLVDAGLEMFRQGRWLLDTPIAGYWQQAVMRLIPEGPSPDYQTRTRATIVARAGNSTGQWLEARLQTPEVYAFTATTSVEIADRVLDGKAKAGFQTPSLLLGSEYMLTLPGVVFTPLGRG
jgi:short subunit dehydrogenase-like uncharacterized protein